MKKCLSKPPQSKLFPIYQKGQSLVEVVFALPLIIGLLSSFFVFVYSQLWFQTIEQALHEGLVCEETLGATGCQLKATLSCNRFFQLGTVLIHGSSHQYSAELFFFGRFQWKTIKVENLTATNSMRKKALP